MSATYTLHVAPHATPGDPSALGRASLVRDGFSFWAFVASPLWFWAHRHWLLGLAVAVLLGVFWVGFGLAGLPGGIRPVLQALLCFLIGLEASSLRRWDYERQDRPVAAVVFAANEAEAETKSFAQYLLAAPETPREAAVPVRATSTPWAPARPGPSIIGLFPDAERRR